MLRLELFTCADELLFFPPSFILKSFLYCLDRLARELLVLLFSLLVELFWFEDDSRTTWVILLATGKVGGLLSDFEGVSCSSYSLLFLAIGACSL